MTYLSVYAIVLNWRNSRGKESERDMRAASADSQKIQMNVVHEWVSEAGEKSVDMERNALPEVARWHEARPLLSLIQMYPCGMQAHGYPDPGIFSWGANNLMSV